MPAVGDVVSWRRTIKRGQSTVKQSGYAVVCELGRGHASVWPLSGPVDRRLRVDLADLTVLLPGQDLLAELDRRSGAR